MLKTLMIVATVATVSVAIPTATFAQMENDMGGNSMSKGSMGMSNGSMGGMKSKSSMMKKKKMHHSMHQGMMKKPMSDGGM